MGHCSSNGTFLQSSLLILYVIPNRPPCSNDTTTTNTTTTISTLTTGGCGNSGGGAGACADQWSILEQAFQLAAFLVDRPLLFSLFNNYDDNNFRWEIGCVAEWSVDSNKDAVTAGENPRTQLLLLLVQLLLLPTTKVNKEELFQQRNTNTTTINHILVLLLVGVVIGNIPIPTEQR